MKKIKLFLAALLAIVGASSMKALEPADLAGNYLWNYKDGNVDRENTVSIAVSGDELTISDMFLDPLKATIQEEGGDTYLVIAKGQGGIYNGKSQYEVQGSADRLTGWGEADIKGKIGTDGVITFDCYLRAFIVGTGSTIGSDYGKGSTFTPLSGELPSVVELPAGATVEEYQLAYMQLGRRKTKAVGVAIVDNDVYVQGFADFLPEAWVKGTISGNNWTFSANQYLGKVENNDCYFFSNGETTFTYNGENAYVATQVSGKVAGVVLALYIGPELSKEFDPVPYATISIDGENMTFRYDLDYYSASKEVGTSFSHVYRLPWTGYQPEWWNDVETLGKIKKVSFNASFGKYEDITDLYGFFEPHDHRGTRVSGHQECDAHSQHVRKLQIAHFARPEHIRYKWNHRWHDGLHVQWLRKAQVNHFRSEFQYSWRECHAGHVCWLPSPRVARPEQVRHGEGDQYGQHVLRLQKSQIHHFWRGFQSIWRERHERHVL